MGDKVEGGASPPYLGKAVHLTSLSQRVLGGKLNKVVTQRDGDVTETRAQSWRQSRARAKGGGVKGLEANGLGVVGGGRVGSPGPSGPGLARKGGHSDSLSGVPTRGHSPLCSRKTPSSSTLKERRLLRQPGHAQKGKLRGEAF